MTSPEGEFSISSAYDAQSNLRMVRIAGSDIPPQALLAYGLADRTLQWLPTAKNLVDMRSWEYEGSTYEVEDQAETLTELFRGGMGVAYVWLTTPGALFGATWLFRQALPVEKTPNVVVTSTLEDALDRLEVSMTDYLRVEAALERIILPD